MRSDTFVLIAAQYGDEQDALADCAAAEIEVRRWDDAGTFDAAVVTKDARGRVRIVRRIGDPLLDATEGGLATGLALGALVALFPAIGLGAGLLVGGSAGAGAGALKGRAAGGLRDADLTALGDLLEAGQSGFVLAAATRLRGRLIRMVSRSTSVAETTVRTTPATSDRDVPGG